MEHFGPALPFALALGVGMLICLEIGRRMGLRRLAKDPDAETSDFGVVEGAVLGLYGLMIAFTFSGASARFDVRREQIALEANAIGTAYLRVDLLPAASQPPIREAFRRYVDSRTAMYRSARTRADYRDGLAASVKIQNEIWQAAVAACRLPDGHPDAARLLLPALNEMIDITTTRLMATKIHPPLIIFSLLFILALTCSTMAGYAMASSHKRSLLHIGVFVAASVVASYVILEIEYPRVGIIKIDPAADEVLYSVREGMN